MLFPECKVDTGAVFSPDNIYRYKLWRIWNRLHQVSSGSECSAHCHALTGGVSAISGSSSIEAIRNRASLLGFKVYGVLNGWKGLLGDGDIVDRHF